MMTNRVDWPVVLIVLALLAVVVGSWFWSFAVWVECRQAHPWWYCLRILG